MHSKRRAKYSRERAQRMAKARWDADRARRDAEEPERIRELAAHPLIQQGDAIGVLEFRCIPSGLVRRWRVLRGDRVDRVILETPDGRRSKSHGWTRILNSLRGVFAGTKV